MKIRVRSTEHIHVSELLRKLNIVINSACDVSNINHVWQSRVIESIICRIPINIILLENAAGRYDCIDGNRRIYAINSFFYNKFALWGCMINPLLNEKKYNDLTPHMQNMFDGTYIYATYIDYAAENDPAEVTSIIRAQIH